MRLFIFPAILFKFKSIFLTLEVSLIQKAQIRPDWMRKLEISIENLIGEVAISRLSGRFRLEIRIETSSERIKTDVT